MKNFLIPIIILFFIGCGTISNSDNNGSTIVSESNQTNIENNNSSIASENNQTAIEDNNNSLTSLDDVKDYLASSNSNYQLTPINNISEENIKTYINSDSNYDIKPLVQKTDYNSNIEIFYDRNKSKIIPKDKIYIVENSNKTQIFTTFNLDGNYSKIENATALLIYHNTFNQPTGFTNIKTSSLTIDSLIKSLEKAFNQVGINNLEVNNTTIIYHTAPKNSGKVFQCSVNGTPEAVSITIDSNGKTNLNNGLSPDMNISCSLDKNGSNSILLSDIIKLDFNDTTISQSPTPTPTVEPTPTTPTIEQTPINNNIHIDTLSIDSAESHKAHITMKIFSIENQKLEVTAQLVAVDDGITFSSDKKEITSDGIYEFNITDVSAPNNYNKQYDLKYIIVDKENGISTTIKSARVTIWGTFTYTQPEQPTIEEKDVIVDLTKSEINYSNYYNFTIDIDIKIKSEYTIKLLLKNNKNESNSIESKEKRYDGGERKEYEFSIYSPKNLFEDENSTYSLDIYIVDSHTSLYKTIRSNLTKSDF